METMEIRKKRRICLVVAYDGTNYQGWQIQQNGNTIEAELNRALSALTRSQLRFPVRVVRIPVSMRAAITRYLIPLSGCPGINFPTH